MKKYPSMRANDRMVNDAYAFLEKQLEKCDPKILEPLKRTLWPRDMPVKTGGGFLENVSVVDVQYATTGNGENSLLFNTANDIPVMQADFGKTVSRVFNWAQYLSVSYIEKQKFQNIAMNIEDVLNKGVHLAYDQFCDDNVYMGFTKVGSTGLLNNANVARGTAAPHTEGGTDTKWEDKDPDDILKDFNDALTAVWTANEMAEDALPNQILIPVEQFGMLVTRKVGVTGDKSILTYIKENNIVTQQGKNLEIFPCKYCKGAGSGNSDRMVVYINDVDKIRYHQTATLRRLNTEIGNLAFKTPYVAQVSEVEFCYPTTVRYVDGI